MSQAVAVPSGVFDKVFQYLHQRPYNEVHSLIEELRSSVQVVSLEEEKEVEDDGAK
jgi:hypothetical protein